MQEHPLCVDSTKGIRIENPDCGGSGFRWMIWKGLNLEG